jgi:hypothetical protein
MIERAVIFSFLVVVSGAFTFRPDPSNDMDKVMYDNAIRFALTTTFELFQIKTKLE